MSEPSYIRGSTPRLAGLTPQGRRCFLSLRAGPVRDAGGNLVALELLSDIRDRRTGERLAPDVFFARAPAEEQLRILSWQLDVVAQQQTWYRARQLRVSLNISRTLALLLLTTPSVAAQICRLRDILRLELSEYFISPGGCDVLVGAMGELAPLWLDDFGCGTTPYVCLTEGWFEAVKVDRGFMVRLSRMPGGAAFLQGMSELVTGTGTQVIAEGIEDRQLWTFALQGGVSACQGWLWPEVCLSELDGLPDCFSD